jgi:hypothetical protein
MIEKHPKMEALRDTQKKFGSRAMITAITLGFALILAGFKPMGKGLVLGTVFSILNFVLMGELLPLRMKRSKRQATVFSLGSIMIRYALLAIPLIVAFKVDAFNLGAVIAGLFMVQFMVLTDSILNTIPIFSAKRS